MALTTDQLLDYSWMSQASYLDFTGLSSGTSNTALENVLTNNGSINAAKILADKQAKLFADSYSFISHTPNDTTGFSATVFKSNSNNTYTIAVRGTEPSLDQALQDLIWADGLGVAIVNRVRLDLISPQLPLAHARQ